MFSIPIAARNKIWYLLVLRTICVHYTAIAGFLPGKLLDWGGGYVLCPHPSWSAYNLFSLQSHNRQPFSPFFLLIKRGICWHHPGIHMVADSERIERDSQFAVVTQQNPRMVTLPNPSSKNCFTQRWTKKQMASETDSNFSGCVWKAETNISFKWVIPH